MNSLKNIKVTSRGIQIALGLLWLLDGLLQLQPRMFTADFANNVIIPAAQGQPDFVAEPMLFLSHIFLLQPVLFNALIALVQISLGLLILWKRTARLGLWASVFWGLFVWYIGEGLSGLASGHTLLLMGAPGAALLYAVLTLGVMVPRTRRGPSDKRPAYFLLIFWVLLWIMGSVYQLLPGQNTVTDVSSMISTNASSAPSWLATIDNSVVETLSNIGTAPASMDGMSSMTPDQMAVMPTHQVSGLWFLVLLALVQVFIGLGVILPGIVRKFAITLGCIFALVYWVVGQSMGSYFSGIATDPNSGPLFVLLGIALLGCTQHDERIRAFFRRMRERIIAEGRAFNEA